MKHWSTSTLSTSSPHGANGGAVSSGGPDRRRVLDLVEGMLVELARRLLGRVGILHGQRAKLGVLQWRRHSRPLRAARPPGAPLQGGRVAPLADVRPRHDRVLHPCVGHAEKVLRIEGQQEWQGQKRSVRPRQSSSCSTSLRRGHAGFHGARLCSLGCSWHCFEKARSLATRAPTNQRARVTSHSPRHGVRRTNTGGTRGRSQDHNKSKLT